MTHHPDRPPPEATVKPWGWSLPLCEHPYGRLVLACVREGGASSVHRHVRQDNAFVILSGILLVTTYADDGTPLNHKILDPLEEPCVVVPAGIKHRMKALEDAVLHELYVGVDGHVPIEGDIVRDVA